MQNIAAAAIIGAAIVIASYLTTTRYHAFAVRDGAIYVLDKRLGKVFYCRDDSCKEIWLTDDDALQWLNRQQTKQK